MGKIGARRLPQLTKIGQSERNFAAEIYKTFGEMLPGGRHDDFEVRKGNL